MIDPLDEIRFLAIRFVHTWKVFGPRDAWRKARKKIKEYLNPLSRQTLALVPRVEAGTDGESPYNHESAWIQGPIYQWCTSLLVSPKVNFLIPSGAAKHRSAGAVHPLILACYLTSQDVPVRVIFTNDTTGYDPSEINSAIQEYDSDLGAYSGEIEYKNGLGAAASVGKLDVMFATAWWTAWPAYDISKGGAGKPFVYLIQDYEPVLHSQSTEHYLALNSYHLNFLPIFSTELLADYFMDHDVGQLSSNPSSGMPISYNPSSQKSLFESMGERSGDGKIRVTVYLRPDAGRNLSGLLIEAIKLLNKNGIITDNLVDLQVIGSGYKTTGLSLSDNLRASVTGWQSYRGYMQVLRQSDVVVSLMASPHPNMITIEGAAAGASVVTTVFGNKTHDRLKSISPLIDGRQISADSIAVGIATALCNRRTKNVRNTFSRDWPESWTASFQHVGPAMTRRIRELLNLRHYYS